MRDKTPTHHHVSLPWPTQPCTMMEHRKAFTISLAVDKDTSKVGNPFRIAKRRLSSGFGKLEEQPIHWTQCAGYKARCPDSQQRNGSTVFDHNQKAMARLGMGSRRPCLILTDVLKTEQGRAYLDRNGQRQVFPNGGQMTSSRRESGRRRESHICEVSKEGPAHRNRAVTPKGHQKASPLPPRRRRLEEEEEEEEEEEVTEVIIGEDIEGDPKYTEVVGSSSREAVPIPSPSSPPPPSPIVLSGWRGDPGRDDYSPGNAKTRSTDQWAEVQHSEKRKREAPELNCNGTGITKSTRGSVLRLTGEARRIGGLPPKRLCLGPRGGGGEPESLDSAIVCFTVGGDEGAEEGLSPIVSPVSGVREARGSPRLSLSSSQDALGKASPSEPIVLSSDDEEGGEVPQRRSSVFQPAVGAGETETQRLPSQEDNLATQEEEPYLQVVRVVVPDFELTAIPSAVVPTLRMPSITSVDYFCSVMAFSALHCGGHQGKANGDITISDNVIVIPLKDMSGQVEVTLTLERTELRRYSVWEEQELQDWDLGPPPAFLLLYVSDALASDVQRDLRKLSGKGHRTTGQASPFILLSLTKPLEGVEGAVLRSVLDIVCLNNLALQETPDIDAISGLEDIHSPHLSLSNCLELIRTTRLDPQLLSLLGLDSSESGADEDQEEDRARSPSDGEKETEAHVKQEAEPQTQPVLEPQPQPNTEPELEATPEEMQKDVVVKPTQESSGQPIPIYTVCHCRTRGSYSVSVSKPDSNWTKYRHQGPAHRLIQFPPPPSKGGITVTMEDLECLDSGQFLNDVIIDFYLKYLLQKAPDALVQRCHIFSSFFYKQLTRRDNAGEDLTSAANQRLRRHQRVKTWTRHVDIFKKDFLFVPVNQESHWYLVVICFPGLEESRSESLNGLASQNGTGEGTADELQAEEETRGSRKENGVTEAAPGSTHSDNQDRLTGASEKAQEDSTKEAPPGPMNCTEQTCQRETVCKRPCILIMDSLKLSQHERVFKLLREYLQSEWEVRRGSTRDFGAEQMRSSHCRVPLQDNSSDCGLYLLQYVESFLKDPVVHFELPLRLERWFPRQLVRRKRDEIRDLVLHLYRLQNRGSVSS